PASVDLLWLRFPSRVPGLAAHPSATEGSQPMTIRVRAAVLWLCAFVFAGCAGGANGPAVKVGAIVPSFALDTLDGARLSDSSLEGKIVILNFWSTTCPACVAELPALNELVNRPGVEVVGIALDAGPSPVRSFLG